MNPSAPMKYTFWEIAKLLISPGWELQDRILMATSWVHEPTGIRTYKGCSGAAYGHVRKFGHVYTTNPITFWLLLPLYAYMTTRAKKGAV